MKREKKKTKRKKKAKQKKKLRAKKLKQRRLVQKQKLKAKELQKWQNSLILLLLRRWKESLVKSGLRELKDNSKLLSDLMINSYSLKASYRYRQLSILIAIWFYEWWLNNNKNSIDY